MIASLSLILLCQLVGEVAVRGARRCRCPGRWLACVLLLLLLLAARPLSGAGARAARQ